MKRLLNECMHQRQQICLLASGALPEAERLEIETHLTNCSSCRSYFDGIKSVVTPLAVWENRFVQIEPTEGQKIRWAKAIKAASELNPSVAASRQSAANPSIARWRRSAETPPRSGSGGLAMPKSWNLFPLVAVRTLWRELIWPVRRIWAGLALAWVFIAIVNHNLSEGRPVAMAKDARPAADIFLAWREQELVLAELVGKAEPTIAEPPKQSMPQPRSERSQTWATV